MGGKLTESGVTSIIAGVISSDTPLQRYGMTLRYAFECSSTQHMCDLTDMLDSTEDVKVLTRTLGVFRLLLEYSRPSNRPH